MRIGPVAGVVVVVLSSSAVGCRKSREPVETGFLCLAPNPAEVFLTPPKYADPLDDAERSAAEIAADPDLQARVQAHRDKPMALRIGDETVPVPNEQRAFPELPEGTLVQFLVDGKERQAWRISYREHGKRVCHYFRPWKDLTLTAGWVLDADRENDRCSCP